MMPMSLDIIAFLAGATDRMGSVLAWTTGVMLPMLVPALASTIALS